MVKTTSEMPNRMEGKKKPEPKVSKDGKYLMKSLKKAKQFEIKKTIRLLKTKEKEEEKKLYETRLLQLRNLKVDELNTLCLKIIDPTNVVGGVPSSENGNNNNKSVEKDWAIQRVLQHKVVKEANESIMENKKKVMEKEKIKKKIALVILMYFKKQVSSPCSTKCVKGASFGRSKQTRLKKPLFGRYSFFTSFFQEVK